MTTPIPNPSPPEKAALRTAAAEPFRPHVVTPTWLPPVDARSRFARGSYPGPIQVYGAPVPAPAPQET